MTVDTVDLVYAVLGVGALLAALLPALLEHRPVSLPLIFVCLGMGLFLLPLGLPDPDPLSRPELTEHLTEVGVIIALTGAGLKLDRPVGLRAWSSTWRLLGIAMPLTIAATALAGWWWVGLAPATALLLGSALAPTDPVLASDVQVGEPTEHEDSEDEVRFALTSEAGLNDALAFPFVYAAIAMAAVGTDPSRWLTEWLVDDVVYKLGVGIASGVVIGWLVGRLAFRARTDTLRLAKHAEGFVALAVTFLAYGVTEVLGGYGFLAVFVCACSIRNAERTHEYHQVLHDFSEQIERLLTVLLLLLFGGAVAKGLLAPLTLEAAAVGLAVIVLIRPLAAWVALRGGLGTRREKGVIAAFGIRGIGSFYYLAYAMATTEFADADLVWATVGFVVLVSVTVHGVTATPVMAWLDRRQERSRTRQEARAAR